MPRRVLTRKHAPSVVPVGISFNIDVSLENQWVAVFPGAAERHQLAILRDSSHDEVVQRDAAVLVHHCTDVLERCKSCFH